MGKVYSNRIGRYAFIISAILHVGIFILLKNKSPRVAEIPVEKSVPIKLTEISPIDRPSKSRTRKKVKNRGDIGGIGSGSRLTYNDLLPQAPAGFPVATVTEKHLEGQWQHGDAEDGELSDSLRFGDLSKLKVFAKMLAERISVPTLLPKIQPNATAAVRFSRASLRSWHATDPSGDPYYRSLVFEVLNTLPENDLGYIKLRESEFQTLRIHFEMETVSVSNTSAKELMVSVDGNKIFIKKIRWESNPNWNLLAVSPTGMPALNLIGVGMVLARPFIASDPHNDLEIKKLRLATKSNSIFS